MKEKEKLELRESIPSVSGLPQLGGRGRSACCYNEVTTGEVEEGPRLKILRSIGVATLFLLLVACGNQLTQPSLEKDLDKAVEKLESSEDGGLGNGILRMNYVTRFSWDRFYIFGPGTKGADIEKALGFPWSDGEELATDLKEGENLLVFVKNDRVKRYVQYQGRGDFVERNKPLTPHNAVFQAVISNGKTKVTPVTEFK